MQGHAQGLVDLVRRCHARGWVTATNPEGTCAGDVKSTPLKRLQGWIWQASYADGALVADSYPDVAPRLRAWREAGRRLAVYSSGSIEAQQLLFAHTTAGDLAPLFERRCDTQTGAKIQELGRATKKNRGSCRSRSRPIDVSVQAQPQERRRCDSWCWSRRARIPRRAFFRTRRC